MEEIPGWKSDVHVDSVDQYPMDQITAYLGRTWEGEMVYESPGRFSISAHSQDRKGSLGMRVISDQLYEWDSYSSSWSNLGQVSDEQRNINPLWDHNLTNKLSLKEGDSMEEVDNRLCKVFSFDEDITVKESIMNQTIEIPYHYAGKFYIDNVRDLIICMDYVVEIPNLGRSHYRYNFYSLGEQTSVEIPPNVEAPPGG